MSEDFGSRSSFRLLQSARGGEPEALEQLYRRYLPSLKHWAKGRLPRWARDLVNTEDLVQETIISSLRHVENFEYRREGAFQVYLRKALVNRIRNEIRRAKRTPLASTLGEIVTRQESPLQALIDKDALRRFDTAFQKLRPTDQEAVIGRVELGFSYKELAEILDKPSADAARMAVKRAVKRLADIMTNL